MVSLEKIRTCCSFSWCRNSEEEKPVDPRLPPPSTYLLKEQPKRGGKKAKTHTKTNLYLLVDFGLQVRYTSQIPFFLRHRLAFFWSLVHAYRHRNLDRLSFNIVSRVMVTLTGRMGLEPFGLVNNWHNVKTFNRPNSWCQYVWTVFNGVILKMLLGSHCFFFFHECGIFRFHSRNVLHLTVNSGFVELKSQGIVTSKHVLMLLIPKRVSFLCSSWICWWRETL